jgi:MoaA/NifB/PqqE/SkfB family radical SAM enzyme
MSLMSAPFHINWNISYACNFNCVHCYSRTHAKELKLTRPDKLKIAENIARSHVFSVNLGGGEPLLDEDVFAIVRFLHAHYVQVSLSSNGWHIDKALVSKLKTAGLDAIVLSLDDADSTRHDALRRQPGSHASCLEAAQLFTEYHIPVRFSTVLLKQNFDSLANLVALAQETAALGIEFKRLRLQGNAKTALNLTLSPEQEQALYGRIKSLKTTYDINIDLVYGETPVDNIDGGCPCGKTALSILSNGDISPCVYNPQVIGNALKDDIDVIWQSSIELDYLRQRFSCQGLERIYA